MNREWYINSGYHRWTSTDTYEGMIKSLPGHRERLMAVLDQIDFRNVAKDKRVLEVAFNNGKSVFWTLEKYGPICSFSMFDFDPNVVEWTKKVNKKWDIDIFEADVQDIPRPDDSFDIVFCLDVIEHLPEDVYQKMIDEIYRVLTPGGFTLVHIGKGKASGHIHCISDTKARDDFLRRGFTIEDNTDTWRAYK